MLVGYFIYENSDKLNKATVQLEFLFLSVKSKTVL